MPASKPFREVISVQDRTVIAMSMVPRLLTPLSRVNESRVPGQLDMVLDNVGVYKKWRGS